MEILTSDTFKIHPPKPSMPGVKTTQKQLFPLRKAPAMKAAWQVAPSSAQSNPGWVTSNNEYGAWFSTSAKGRFRPSSRAPGIRKLGMLPNNKTFDTSALDVTYRNNSFVRAPSNTTLDYIRGELQPFGGETSTGYDSNAFSWVNRSTTKQDQPRSFLPTYKMPSEWRGDLSVKSAPIRSMSIDKHKPTSYSLGKRFSYTNGETRNQAWTGSLPDIGNFNSLMDWSAKQTQNENSYTNRKAEQSNTKDAPELTDVGSTLADTDNLPRGLEKANTFHAGQESGLSQSGLPDVSNIRRPWSNTVADSRLNLPFVTRSEPPGESSVPQTCPPLESPAASGSRNGVTPSVYNLNFQLKEDNGESNIGTPQGHSTSGMDSSVGTLHGNHSSGMVAHEDTTKTSFSSLSSSSFSAIMNAGLDGADLDLTKSIPGSGIKPQKSILRKSASVSKVTAPFGSLCDEIPFHPSSSKSRSTVHLTSSSPGGSTSSSAKSGKRVTFNL